MNDGKGLRRFLIFIFLIIMISAFIPVLHAAAKEDSAENTVRSALEEPHALPEGPAAPGISLYDWFKRGGPFMWPILVLAAVGMGFVIERFLYYRRMKLNPREFIEELDAMIGGGTVEEVERLCRRGNLVIARVLGKGLKLRGLGLDHVEKAIGAGGAIEVAALERGLHPLGDREHSAAFGLSGHGVGDDFGVSEHRGGGPGERAPGGGRHLRGAGDHGGGAHRGDTASCVLQLLRSPGGVVRGGDRAACLGHRGEAGAGEWCGLSAARSRRAR